MAGKQPAPTTLSDMNIDQITRCAEQLSITTPCTRASHLPQFTAHRTQRLIDICDHLGCDTYVSPAGAAGYLATDRFVDQTAIALDFANYQPPAYRQFGHDDFVSHLSIIIDKAR
jgi:hypothetical protein